MVYPYQCVKCGKQFDGDYPMGKAPRVVPCPSCGGSGKRVYAGVSISVRVGGKTATGFGEQMKQKNVEAGRRMQAKKPPVRLAALDFGGGKIREVRAK